MKKSALLIITVITSLSMAFPIFAGEWKQNSTGWWYQNDDGSNPAGDWKQIDGTWYYFKPDGYMNTGWIKVNGQWYYCESSGAMRTADLQTDVFTFRFNTDGSCSNFYENTTPSTQAGWASYGTTSLPTFADAVLSGDVIYYGGLYWAKPDFVSTLKNEEVVYYHDVSNDTNSTSTTNNRYALSEIEIEHTDDEDDFYDLDGID